MHFAKKKKKTAKSQKNKTKQKAFIVARQRLKFETSLLKIEDLLHYEFKCQKFCKIIFWGLFVFGSQLLVGCCTKTERKSEKPILPSQKQCDNDMNKKITKTQQNY